MLFCIISELLSRQQQWFENFSILRKFQSHCYMKNNIYAMKSHISLNLIKVKILITWSPTAQQQDPELGKKNKRGSTGSYSVLTLRSSRTTDKYRWTIKLSPSQDHGVIDYIDMFKLKPRNANNYQNLTHLLRRHNT